VSDDGRHAITVIALLGSVFSPYYAEAIACGAGEPLDHCAMNVALYRLGSASRQGLKGDKWALTERDARSLSRSGDALSIGPSSIAWEADALRIDFDEITAPVPSRLRGTVRVRPHDLVGEALALDAAGKHTWSPIAPCGRAEVTLTHPDVRFSGTAYVDANAGDESLERAFKSWTWSRASGERAKETAVTYDVERRDGTRALHAKVFGGGSSRDLEGLAPRPLGATRWRLDRSIQVDRGTSPRLLRTLEDTPFYARSLASASFAGQASTVVHEALSLDRFREGWVRFLLPFRIRRRRA
jgi:carotenoid 1,2-hydratase